jgi:hypothetical protein
MRQITLCRAARSPLDVQWRITDQLFTPGYQFASFQRHIHLEVPEGTSTPDLPYLAATEQMNSFYENHGLRGTLPVPGADFSHMHTGCRAVTKKNSGAGAER